LTTILKLNEYSIQIPQQQNQAWPKSRIALDEFVDGTEIIQILEQYLADFKGILSRFVETHDAIRIRRDDDPAWRQKVLEVRDLLTDALGPNNYSRQITEYYNEGISNFTGSPSHKSVEDIIGVLGAVVTRLRRNPGLAQRTQGSAGPPATKNIFVVHGRDEAKWRELKDILRERFGLNPIILQEQPDAGCPTLIEKFEYYAEMCSYAVAIFTPDDEVTDANGEAYLQARPNVIYELGWFCGKLGRGRVMLLLKEETSVFSDFGGIIQKRFRSNVSEKIEEIRKDLEAAGVLSQ